jgi:catechol 2,3-dioxygenase-like lactoylglutathione lyase family enzyme
MEITHLYHLTTLVEDLAEAEQFYAEVFSPHCFMRGYAPLPLHRDAALLNIADTVIEPMEPRPPEGDDPATTMYRFIDRFGPRVHSLALLVTGADEIAGRLDEAGVRWTDGGLANHVFPHPKDFPGLLELADFGPALEHFPLADPRMRPGFDAGYWRDMHPLGIDHTSHYTLVVHDCSDAADRYVRLLGARRLPDQPAMTPGARSAYVALAEGAVLELAEPVDADCPFASDLEEVGQTWCGLTFNVVDLERVRAHLTDRHRLEVIDVDRELAALDRVSTFGVHHGFTTRAIVGV